VDGVEDDVGDGLDEVVRIAPDDEGLVTVDLEGRGGGPGVEAHQLDGLAGRFEQRERPWRAATAAGDGREPLGDPLDPAELGPQDRNARAQELFVLATFDEREAEKLEKALRTKRFTLDDFRATLGQIRKMGPLEQVLAMVPGAKVPAGANVDERQLVRFEAIINSMTPAERADHRVLNGSRRKRIARGSGTTVQDVNRLIKQYLEMQKLMKAFGGRGRGGKFRRLLGR